MVLHQPGKLWGQSLRSQLVVPRRCSEAMACCWLSASTSTRLGNFMKASSQQVLPPPVIARSARAMSPAMSSVPGEKVIAWPERLAT